MRKMIVLIAVLAVLGTPALAVRYGVKKHIYSGGSMAYPSNLCYSPASDRMYALNAGLFTVLSMDCAGDSSLGPLSGTVYAAPMVYDGINNRIYTKDTDFFTAIDCGANAVDTNFMISNGSAGIEYNPDNNKIYVYEGMSPDILVYDPATYSSTGTIANVMGTVHYYSPNNSLYSLHALMDSLMIYSGSADARTGAIYLPGLTSAFNEKMASNPAISRLYISMPNTDQVAVINTATNSVVTAIPVLDNPNSFALCPLNDRMFIACNGTSQYSLKYIDGSDLLDSVQVGDSVSTVIYNPADSLIYVGCWYSGYVKLVDPRLPTPMVVDSVYTVFSSHFMDMKVDQGGDVYCAMYNSDDIYVIGQIPQRMWRSELSGWWDDYMIWNYSDDGGTTWQFSGMMETPNCITDSLVLIQPGHTITVSNPATVDQLLVNGVLDQNSAITVNDGPGEDIVVAGVYQRQMGPLTVNPGAALIFGPGSQYVHNLDGDTIPAAVWDSLSQLNITGVMTNMPSGLDQAFGNISWEGSQQAVDVTLPGGAGFSARDIFIGSTGSNTVCLTSPAKPQLAINNLQISQGTAILGSGGNRQLHVKGDLTIYDPGWLYLTDTLNRGIDTLFLYGNYIHMLAGIAGGGPDSTAIVFCGADTQHYEGMSEYLTGHIDYVVFPGAHLLIPEWNVLGQGSLGDFKLMNGASLSYSSMFGLYPAGWDEGVIRSQGSREYSQGANYRLYGISTGPYVTGPGIPDTVNQLIVESSMDQAYLSKDVAVMDTLKLLGNNLVINGKRLSLFGPIEQTLGNLVGDGASQLALMGGNTLPVTLPNMLKDVGTMILNRPATFTMTDTLLVHQKLDLVNGILDNGGFKLSFLDASSISRSSNGSLAGAGSVIFVNQVGLEYGPGIITAGPEMPASNMAIMYLAVKGSTDTLIVDRDTLNVWNSLSLAGGLRFNGKSFTSYGLVDTVGPAGELIFTDSCRANIFGTGDTIYLPGISRGRLTLDNSAGGVLRRDVYCSGPLTINTGSWAVGHNTLTLEDSLMGAVALATDSTSSLIFQGNAVNQVLPSSVSHLGFLSWNRPATLFVTSPLVLHDSLKLGQGSVDNSVNLTLRSGVTIYRNSGILAMPAVLEGQVDVVYGSHGGGMMITGNELPTNGTDLNNLSLSLGLMSNDTIALSGSVQVNGRLSLQHGTLAVGANTLTLRDSIDLLMGQLEADSLSNLWLLGCPYNFTLPGNIARLGTLTLESSAGFTVADSLYIRGNYRQFAGHLLAGKLYYGPAATLSYFNIGLDTTSDREFPAAGGPRNLMVMTGSQLFLHASRTVAGELTLGSPLITGSSVITIDSLGTVGGGSYVEGNLAKLIPVSGDTSITFELGAAPGGISPVAIRAFNNTVEAFITAGIKGAGHPLVSDSSACLNKYWTLSGAGLGADACQITLNYLPGDFNPPGFEEAFHESTMTAGRYDPPYSAWQLPGIIARNFFGVSDGGSIVLAHAGNFNDNPEFTLGRDSSAFIIMADTIGPYYTFVQPFNGMTGVRLNEQVMISFDEPVDSLSLRFTCTPDPGGWTRSWDPGSQNVYLNHNLFSAGTTYSFRLDSLQDLAGNQLRSDTIPGPNPWSFTAVPNDTTSYAWAGGAYRLVSVPVVPGDTTAAGNFGDDLGAYSDTTWRLFGYKPGAGYVENPRISNGYGYWMASSSNASLDVIGTPPDQFVTVPVDSGWNIIGMPFDTVLHLTNITIIWTDTTSHYLRYDSSLVNTVFRQRLWSWNDPTNDLVNDDGVWDSLTPFNPADSLRSWQGYAAYAVRPCTLQISPIGSKNGKISPAPQAQVDWQLYLDVASGRSSDRGLRLGVSPQAEEKYDRLDAEKPPLIASSLRAYFPHDDWGQGPCQAYQYDFRPSSWYIEWPLKVDLADQNRQGNLTYSLEGDLEPGYTLYLVDRKNLKTMTIAGTGELGFTGSQELAVVYSNNGPGSYGFKPLSLELGWPRPNPFGQQADISYQLPQPGRVSLKIYNISGQLVRTLVDRESPPGYYTVRWDGCDHGGLRVSSGIYIARLSTAGRDLVQKLVKVR